MELNKENINIIAFYLPQYHPTPDNDKWWGKGFTEWTNVGKATKLFSCHYQPKVPADLGYYDLRLPEVREAQAALAREAGIAGFCYYHYWFGNGKRELELPFNEVLKLGKPNFPFMLCWANESWHNKFWNIDGTIQKKILIEQTYPGDEDIKAHFETLLPAFQDSRYIKIDGKPVFMIYRFEDYPDVTHFIELWQELARKVGFPGIYFITQKTFGTVEKDIDTIKSKGFDAVNTLRLSESINKKRGIIKKIFSKLLRKLLQRPLIFSYKKFYKEMIQPEDSRQGVYPTLYPNWDHTPRSGSGGTVVTDTTPELFELHARYMLDIVSKKDSNPNIVFLKSWNEWGEGNYMEPDLKYGKAYLEALRRALNCVRNNK